MPLSEKSEADNWESKDHDDVSDRSPGGRPTKAQAVARTENLLDGARELFCSKGFASTSIDEIAAVLRFSKHTIYRRYTNKLVLLEAVVDRDVSRFRQALLADVTEHEPLSSLQSMARTYFQFSASPGYSALYAAIALEAASSAHLREKLRGWTASSLEPLFGAIEAAAPSRGWNADDASKICEILIDLLDGQANRAKWLEISIESDAIEQMFIARWNIFQQAMMHSAQDAP